MPSLGYEFEPPVSQEEWEQLTAVEKADWVVTQYITHFSAASHEKVEKEMHGQGCGCASCLKNAATEMNSWLEFLDPDGNFPRYKPMLNNGGKLIVEKVPASELDS